MPKGPFLLGYIRIADEVNPIRRGKHRSRPKAIRLTSPSGTFPKSRAASERSAPGGSTGQSHCVLESTRSTDGRLCWLGRIIVGIGRVLKVDPLIEYSRIFSAPDRQTAIRPRNIPVPSGMLLRSTPTNPAASIQPRYCDSV